MVIVVFRTRVKPGAEKEIVAYYKQLAPLAERHPGLIASKDFVAEDGEVLTLVEFESEESLAAWREQPLHREARKRGREALFAAYRVQVCTPIRSYGSR